MFANSLRQFFRGGLGPRHVVTSVLLGWGLGLIPSYAASPGLLLLLMMLVAGLRVNLGLLAVSALASKATLLLTLPVASTLGRLVLQGPLGPLFETLSGMPGFAWFGLERYDLVGALVLAPPIAGSLAFLLNGGIQRFRRFALARAQGEAAQALADGWLGRISLPLLLGPGAREDLRRAFQEAPPLLRGKGLALALAALVAAAPLVLRTQSVEVTALVQPILERVHGATVDLERATLRPAAGALTLTGLALADPDALQQNLFEAAEARVSLSLLGLLAKRIEVTEVALEAPRVGYERLVPGVRTAPLVTPPKVAAPSGQALGEIFVEGRRWQARLAELQGWLERWARSAAPAPAPEDPGYEAWLAAQLEAAGYGEAVHSPIAMAYWGLDLQAAELEDIRLAAFEDRPVTLSLKALGDLPLREGRAPSLVLQSEAFDLRLELSLRALAGAEPHTVRGQLRGLPLDTALAQLQPALRSKVSGGTVDLVLTGTFDHRAGASLALEAIAELREVVLTVGQRAVPVETLRIPARLQGTLTQPRLVVDREALETQLKALAGDAIKAEAQDTLERAMRKKLGGKLKGLIPDS